MIQRTIRAYLVLTACYSLGLALHAATYVTFLMRHGLDLFEVNLVNFAFFTTVALMEVPTGVVADVFGRRLSFLIACALMGVGLVVYGLSGGFWGFVLAEVVIGIGMTFESGAFNAWFVDELKHHGHNGDLTKLFARGAMATKVLGMLGALVGAFVFDWWMPLPWFIGAVVAFMTMGLAFVLMREQAFKRTTGSVSHLAHMRETLTSGVRVWSASTVIRWITILGVIQAFAFQAPNMQWQPFFAKHLSGQMGQGFIWVAIGLAIILGARLAPNFLKGFGSEWRTLNGLNIAVGLSTIATPLLGAQFLPALAMYLAHEVGRAGAEPVKNAYLNKAITASSERATVLSLQSVGKYVGGALGLAISGYVAAQASLTAAWVMSGLVLVLAGVALWSRKPE